MLMESDNKFGATYFEYNLHTKIFEAHVYSMNGLNMACSI